MWNRGKKVDLLVCISHGKGVCLVEKYDKIDGRYFTSFVQRQFFKLFAQNSKTPKKLWIQDGDPSQNCKSAHLAWEELGANLLKIPPQKPRSQPNRKRIPPGITITEQRDDCKINNKENVQRI